MGAFDLSEERTKCGRRGGLGHPIPKAGMFREVYSQVISGNCGKWMEVSIENVVVGAQAAEGPALREQQYVKDG
jgi:hypothetical protein